MSDHLVSNAAPRRVSTGASGTRYLLRVVSQATLVPEGFIVGEGRDLVAAKARFILYWLFHRYTTHSWCQIGARTNRDHATVIHGTKFIRDKVLPIIEPPQDDTPETWAALLWRTAWPDARKRGKRK